MAKENGRNVIDQGNNPKISFENYKINKIELRDLNKEEEKDQFGISIGVNEKKDRVKLGIDVTTENRFIEIEMLGIFKFEKSTSEQEREKFLRINGVAMLYPYIRAYISTITSFNKDGSALIIPTINFQSLYEDENKTKKPKSQEPK